MTSRSHWSTPYLDTAPFILAIFLAFCDCSAIKWVLNPIGEFIAQQSRELKNLLKIASINGAKSGHKMDLYLALDLWWCKFVAHNILAKDCKHHRYISRWCIVILTGNYCPIWCSWCITAILTVHGVAVLAALREFALAAGPRGRVVHGVTFPIIRHAGFTRRIILHSQHLTCQSNKRREINLR